MFACLVKHGCRDLTSSIIADLSPSLVVASGGFGDIRHLTLGDGTPVALKTLRLQILLKDDDKAVKVCVKLPFLRASVPQLTNSYAIACSARGIRLVKTASPKRSKAARHYHISRWTWHGFAVDERGEFAAVHHCAPPCSAHPFSRPQATGHFCSLTIPFQCTQVASGILYLHDVDMVRLRNIKAS